MALQKVKGNLERMFDKNLADLVRGVRNNKENEVSIMECNRCTVAHCTKICPQLTSC